MTKIKKDCFGYDLYYAMHKGNIFERVWHKTRIKRLLKSLDYRNKKIIEIGCNTGPVMIPFLKNGYNITAIDISKDDVFKARNNIIENGIKKSNLCAANASFIPFKDNTFDTALLIDLLEHTSRPDIIAEEVHRILKEEGKALVAVPWKMHPVWNPFIKKVMSGRKNIDEVPDNFLSFKDLKNIFCEFKLEEISLKVFFAWILAIFKK